MDSRALKILDLKRRRRLLALKAKISYKGSDPQRQAEALYWLQRTLDYDCLPRHLDIIRHQNETAYGDRDADLTLGFRGLGKSTSATVVRAIKYIIDDPNVRILFCSDTQGAAEKILKIVRAKLQHNEDLIEMYGVFFASSRHQDKGRYRDSFATVLQRTDQTLGEATITCIGVGGQLASMHFDVIFLDDLVTIRNSRTRKQRENLQDWHGSTLLGCCISTTKIHYIGTRYFPHDAYQVLQEIPDDGAEPILPASSVLRIPAIITGADGVERSNHPERYSLAYFKRKLRTMGRVHFNAQMQQDTSMAEGLVFSYANLRWYGDDDGDVVRLPSGLSVFQYSDLTAKRTTAGDFYVTVTIGVTGESEVSRKRVFVLDMVRERCGMGKARSNMVAALAKWNPILHGVEAVAMQAGFAQEMQETIDRRFHPCTVESDKVFRAQRVAPLVEAGQVYLPIPASRRGKLVDVLVDELCSFPDGQNDDCVDAFVGAITLAVFSGRPAAFGDDFADDDDAGGDGDRWTRGMGFRGRY